MSLSWTPRNTVAVALVLLAATFYALAHFDVVHLEFISNGKIEAYSLGFGLGVVIPGSPIGRVLDKLFPPKGQTVQPITGADIEAVVTEVQSGNPLEPVAGPSQTMPQRVPSSREQGSATVDVLGALAILAGIMLAWISHLRHLWPVLLVCALASTSIGCGSAIATGARGVDTAEQLLAPSMTWAHDARAAQLDACHDTDCESVGQGQWAPLIAALNATRDGLAAVLDGLELAHLHAGNAPTTEQLVALARAVFGSWTTAFDLAQAFGRTLPTLPPEVLALIGGAS